MTHLLIGALLLLAFWWQARTAHRSGPLLVVIVLGLLAWGGF